MSPRPKPIENRKISRGAYGESSDRDGARGETGGGGTRGTTAGSGVLRSDGFSRDEDPLLRESTARSHRRAPSLGNMFQGLATSVRRIVNPSGGSATSGSSDGASPNGGGRGVAPKRNLWGVLHRRIDSIILKGDEESNSEFEYDRVQLDEDDLADLRAAGVKCEGGKVAETPVEIKKKGRRARSILSAIRKKVRREMIFEEADSIRRSFDVTVGECVAAIGAYLALSVLAYSFVFERWSVINSLYFAVVTFTTIGYGDLTPSTIPGQMFMCLFGFSGVAALGLALGVIGSDIVETRVNSANDVKVTAKHESQREAMELFDKTEETAELPNEETGAVPGTEARPGCLAQCCKPFQSVMSSRKAWIMLLLLVMLLSGSVLIAVWEGWNVSTGLYYGIVTTCTIGYGDMSPSKPGTRLFSVFFIPVAVAVMGQILDTFSTYVMEKRQAEFKQALAKVEMGVSHLEGMSSKGDGVVTRLDYIEFMLQVMNVVDREMLDKLHEQFDKLDESGDGMLTETDLKLMAKRKLQSARKKLELADYKESVLRKGCKESATYGSGVHSSLAEAVDSLL